MLARESQDIIRPQTMSNFNFDKDYSPLILAVDTSSAHASFAIGRGQQILAAMKTDVPVPHSKTFFDHVSALLQKADLSISQVDAFAAATGPGSFTGLRVGLSAIKGLSHALGKPAIGVSSIDAAALTIEAIGNVLIIIDAGRGEVYSGLRSIGEGRIPMPLGIDTVCQLSTVLEKSKQYTKGILTVARIGTNEIGFDQGARPDWQIRSPKTLIAEEVAIYAAKVLNDRLSFPLSPNYIRPSDAEIKAAD